MYCTYENCKAERLARGYCNRHYKQLRASGALGRKHHHEYHGMFGTPEYRSWAACIGRCFNPNDKRYGDYAGRGITVCNGFRHSFDAFYSNLGKRPRGTSLDRIDNDGNYSCGKCGQCTDNNWIMNVKWSTPHEQQANKRLYKTSKSGYKNIVWNNRHKKWTLVVQRQKVVIYSASFKKLNDAVLTRDQVLGHYGIIKSSNPKDYSQFGKGVRDIFTPLPGEKNPAAKLTLDQVREIRRLWVEGGYYQREIAVMYGVNQTIVSKIVLNQSWVDEGYSSNIVKRHKWQTRQTKHKQVTN